MPADLKRQQHDLEFDVAKSARYHAAQRNRWAAFDRCNKIATIVSGAIVFATVFAGDHWWTGITGGIVAALSAFDLVFDFGRHERLYDDLYRRYVLLRQEVQASRAKLDDEILIQLRNKRLAIEADEPTIDKWLERKSSKEEALAQGLEVNPIWLETRSGELRKAFHRMVASLRRQWPI